jgi:hypothetical protein
MSVQHDDDDAVTPLDTLRFRHVIKAAASNYILMYITPQKCF